jgi:hypothetical protein
MKAKYSLNYRRSKAKRRHFFLILLISFAIIALLIAGLFAISRWLKNSTKPQSGPTITVGSVTSSDSTSSYTTVNEPYYTFQLPNDWKEISSVSNINLNSITWQSFQPDEQGRYLTIYTDPIPATYAVNLELPVISFGSTLKYGNLSENCINFTNTGTPRSVVPVLAKWDNVNFYCNVPNYVDDQVGTGTTNSINSVSLTGKDSGTHNYFFLYIDRTADPEYNIFFTILDSFKAK